MVATLIALAAAVAAGLGGPPHAAREFGESARGRDLRALRVGPAKPRRRVLVVGSVHGDERAGHEIIDRLRGGSRRLEVALWTVRSVNPDGVARQRRVNARGVDLNRNFPYRWRAAEPLGSGYYQGPRPASEPETRGVKRLIRRLRPRLTIWYHQPWGEVLLPCRGRAHPERLYARIAGMPLNRCPGERLRGTATSWQEARIGGTAFVVELASGALSAPELRRHARAVTRVANRFG